MVHYGRGLGLRKMHGLIYFLIFFIKVIEVSMATVRIVLITRGERLLGAIIGFFEVCLWVLVVSTVLKNITEDPLKIVVYALGFAIGNYAGSMLEEVLAIGSTRVEAIVIQESGKQLANRIREKGYAVTVIAGEGMNMARSLLIMDIPRKKVKSVIALIQKMESNVVITVNEIKPVYGGYGTLRR